MREELERRWLELALANDQPKPDQIWETLRKHYNEPHRHYHNLAHIEACLGWLDHVSDQAEDPVAMEFALWFHDIIYNTLSSLNEQDSADFAGILLIPPVNVEQVCDLILATDHRADVQGDAALLCDIDLATLGSEPSDYLAYQCQIREEYGWAPDPEYFEGRIKVLRHFLSRPKIYVTDAFRHLEESARRNLEAEIQSLSS
ncbi:MAG: N-methyl-D-aspartate receptor NMDAR2C subunit [Verrucomicrobiota bacterium]